MERLFLRCRSGGIRTHDLQHPMLARYQATLHPELLMQIKHLDCKMSTLRVFCFHPIPQSLIFAPTIFCVVEFTAVIRHLQRK